MSLVTTPGSLSALDVLELSHRYGARLALDDLTFQVAPSEVFGLLGPNGGGKTTLFRIVSTLLTPASGRVRVFGHDVVRSAMRIRHEIGVVFQSPALDAQLRVDENLRYHGQLYGLRGPFLRDRIDTVLDLVKLADRAGELVATLSGGLRRRVELAKALLPGPQLLLLDEPSAGLDPGARRELWNHWFRLRQTERTTIVIATHLMDEAALCDRVGILHEGRLVAQGSPDDLVAAIGADVILISATDPQSLSPRVRSRFAEDVELVDDRLRIERPRAHEFVPRLVEAFPGEINAVTFGKPTLEDVFRHHTGRTFNPRS